MRLGVELMHDYALSVGMPEIEKDITVHVYYNFDNLIDADYDTFKPVGVSKEWIRQNVWLNGERYGLGGKEHAFINSSRLDGLHRHFQIQLGAHEFNHAQVYDLIELNLGGDDKTPAEGPLWLVEGTADFFAWQALSEGGIIPYGEVREDRLKYAKRIPDSLEAMETSQGFYSIYNSYDYAMLAVELLASRSGQSSLFQYYASLKPGTTWQDAFNSVFGMTVEEFYDLFEQHRAAGFPKLNIPKLSPTSTPTATPTPVPLSYVNWVLGEDIPQSVRETLEKGVRFVHDYNVSIGMPEIDGEVTFYAYTDFEKLVEAHYNLFEKHRGLSRDYSRERLYDGNFRGIANSGVVFLNMSVLLNLFDGALMSLTGHELVHAQAYHLSGISGSSNPNKISDDGPAWFHEGVASLLPSLALSENGVRRHVDHESERSYAVSADHSGKSLRAFETYGGLLQNDLNYHYSFLAVELLASQASQGSLMEYYASLRSGAAWQTVFKNTFGLSIGEFYDLFEQHEAAGFPKLDIPKFVER